MTDLIDIGKKQANDQKTKEIRDRLFNIFKETDLLGGEICEGLQKLKGRIDTMHDDFLDQLANIMNELCDIYEKYPELKHEDVKMQRIDEDA